MWPFIGSSMAKGALNLSLRRLSGCATLITLAKAAQQLREYRWNGWANIPGYAP